MIEIKCTKQEKERIKDALCISEHCTFEGDTCIEIGISCEECLERNIKWEIKDD